jgi:GTP-binding protein
VDDRPGTTRDPIDVEIKYGEHRYIVVDTAGIRRKAKIEEDVESASVMRALRTAGRGDIVILMSDFSGSFADQDQRLLSLCVDRGGAVVVGLNKTDLLSATERKEKIAEVKRALHFATWVTVVPLSAKTGRGVKELMQTVAKVYAQYTQRVGTATLNKFFASVLERTPPPTHGGKAPRLYYITQAETAPPTFVVMSSNAAAIKESYKRFVQNQLREHFDFDAVPIRVRFRDRRKSK